MQCMGYDGRDFNKIISKIDKMDDSAAIITLCIYLIRLKEITNYLTRKNHMTNRV